MLSQSMMVETMSFLALGPADPADINAGVSGGHSLSWALWGAERHPWPLGAPPAHPDSLDQ